MDTDRKEQATSWWISSLAISIVCCAILFVVFASYIVDLKSNSAVVDMKLDLMEQRENALAGSIENLQRRSMVQQIQLIQATSATPGQGNGGTQPQIPLAAIPAIENAAQGQNVPTGIIAPTAAMPNPPAPAAPSSTVQPSAAPSTTVQPATPPAPPAAK